MYKYSIIVPHPIDPILQEELFLGPIPRGGMKLSPSCHGDQMTRVPWSPNSLSQGWSTTRSSSLCKGSQRASHGSLALALVFDCDCQKKLRGAEELKEPTVRSVRKDAAGLPTWLGVAWFKCARCASSIAAAVERCSKICCGTTGHAKADAGSH